MTGFSGVRVLVVEDEGAIAMMIEDALEQLGCELAASVARVAQACEIAAKADIDIALLDVNVAGELVFPVAQILRERKIPFLFSTGYGPSGLPAEFANDGVLRKPFSDRELHDMLSATLCREDGQGSCQSTPVAIG
jgi:DNA-binding response OmpR family regulator